METGEYPVAPRLARLMSAAVKGTMSETRWKGKGQRVRSSDPQTGAVACAGPRSHTCIGTHTTTVNKLKSQAQETI